jgi:predicted nucleotidyltransferase
MSRVNKILNQKIWDTLCDDDECGEFHVEIKPEIRKALIKIAYDFLSFLDAKIPFKDITITGSMANFNYTDQSDIDLHVIFDFSNQPDLLEELMQAKRKIWNDDHEIRIKGHDVELYPQSSSEPHHSSGVFSVIRNRWNEIPKRTNPEIDEELVLKKSEDLIQRIDFLDSREDRTSALRKTKDKIGKMRRAGLEREGEYSVENLVFKTLRNTGYLEKLNVIIKNDYDHSVSLDQ